MITILTSDHPTILRELGSPAFERIGIRHVVVETGREVVVETRKHAPAVVILEVELADGSGYQLCRELKGDPGCAGTRVVLLVEGAVSAEVIRSLSESRCDEVLVTPAWGEALFHKVAQLLGLPRRLRRRMAVELRAEMAVGRADWSGRIVDLNQDGARLELDREVDKGRLGTVHIHSGTGAAALSLEAKVVWSHRDAASGAWTCGIQFLNPDFDDRSTLMDLSLWEVIPQEDGSTQVVLQGDFREHTELTRLAEQLRGTVEFDLAWVRYLNSAGVRHWVSFLRSLDAVESYRFVRCSVAFVTQASMVPEVLGRGRVDSFQMPYTCEQCDLEEERLMQTTALHGSDTWPPELPDFACPRCRGELVFDDLPQRYFAFLEDDPLIRPS
ncbi:MAG: PilZ domain-containing protein [bacterium]